MSGTQVGFGDVWKQSLSELSGGQRSLLALSLILAMLLFKPAPIYILDEVWRLIPCFTRTCIPLAARPLQLLLTVPWLLMLVCKPAAAQAPTFSPSSPWACHNPWMCQVMSQKLSVQFPHEWYASMLRAGALWFYVPPAVSGAHEPRFLRLCWPNVPTKAHLHCFMGVCHKTYQFQPELPSDKHDF